MGFFLLPFLLTRHQGTLLEFEDVPFLLDASFDLGFFLLQGVAALQTLRHGGLALACPLQGVIIGRDARGVLKNRGTGLPTVLRILQALLGTAAFELEVMLGGGNSAL